MRRPVRLLLLLIGLIVNYAFAEEINVSLYYKGSNRARDVLKVGEALTKQINADNKFLQANFEKIDCADNEEEICNEVSDNVLVKFTEVEHPSVTVKGSLDPSNIPDAKNAIFKTLMEFSSKVYKSRASREDVSDWWKSLDESLQTKIEQFTLHSSEELQEFGKTTEKAHGLLVFYREDNFENFAAVFSALTAAEEAECTVGLVDCEKTPELCEGKSELPVIVNFYKEKENKHFEGHPQTEKVADWIRTLRLPVITQLHEDIVPNYRGGQIPGFTTPRSTVVMLFSPNKTNEPYKIYERFAVENHGKHHLTALVDKGVYMWPHHPAFIVSKPYERVSQAFVLFQDLTEERIVDFIKTSGLPAIHYLSDGKAAEELVSINLPMMIFYDPTGKKDATEFAKLASDHPLRWQTASFAAVTGKNLLGLHFAHELGLEERKPLYAVYSQKTGCLHTVPVENQTKEELEAWLKEVLKKECESEVHLNASSFEDIRLWERKQQLLKQLAAPPKPSFHEEL